MKLERFYHFKYAEERVHYGYNGEKLWVLLRDPNDEPYEEDGVTYHREVYLLYTFDSEEELNEFIPKW